MQGSVSRITCCLIQSGQTFDLSGLPPDDQIGLPYFLAGGIDLTNVHDLIKLRRPFGIDVSSAVETDGLKDAGKIRAMIAKVREMDIKSGQNTF